MPLRQKLFLILGLMTLVPLLVLQFGVVESIETDLELRIAAELQDKLIKMSDELDTLIESQKAMAAGLAEAPVLRKFSLLTLNPENRNYDEYAREVQDFFFNYQRQIPNIQALRYIDQQGKTLVKVKEGVRIEPEKLDGEKGRYYVADQSSKQFYKGAFADGVDVYVSDFELGQVVKNADFCPAMMRYSVPIRNGFQEIEGLVVVNMWGTRIDKTVKTAMAGALGKGYIVEINDKSNRDGVYLFHEDNNYRFGDQLGNNFRFSSDIGKQNWQTIRQASVPGQILLEDGRIYFYRQYSPYKDNRSKWLLLIETSYDAVFAPIAKIRYSIWLLLGILFVMSLFVAKWVAARLAQPVQELANTITRYADGEESARYTDDKRNDEIGVVGGAFNYLCTALDHTRMERDKAENAVRQSERLAAVGQMAAGIGHEINNPLMNIMSLASLVEESIDEDCDPQIRHDLQTLQEEGSRCARIVQGILKFARATEPSIETFNIGTLVKDTLALLQHRADASSVDFKKDIDTAILTEGDPNQLQQVFVNILLNAIHASEAGKNIVISVQREDDAALIRIEDHGKGIPEHEISRVFNPFYSTKPEGEGTGLGLSVSYGIIEKHDGCITLESKEGYGTTVLISLPVKTIVVAVDDAAEQYFDGKRKVADG